MKSRLSDLLEKSRNKSGETQRVFAERLFPQLSALSRQSFYTQIETGQRKLPKKYFSVAAKLLELSIADVRAFNEESVPSFENVTGVRLTGDELRRLAEAADALGKSLSIATVLQIVSDLRESPSA